MKTHVKSVGWVECNVTHQPPVMGYAGAPPILLWVIAVVLLFGGSMAEARVTFPIYDEEGMNQACAQVLGDAKRRVGEIQSLPVRVNPDVLLSAWNNFEIELGDVIGLAYLFAAVHPDDKVRAAAEACTSRYKKFDTELFQNEMLYQHFVAVKPSDPIGKQLKKKLLENFEDGGVSLPAEKRQRAAEILQKLESLRLEYERNVRENKTRLEFTADEMRGLPESYLEKAKRDSKGNYLLGFDSPDFVPFMTNADDESARKRYYIAYVNRGTARNLDVMKEVASLRQELAGLYGLRSYSEFVTRRLMVGNPENVRKFLVEVKAAVKAGEAREVAELRELKARLTGSDLKDGTVTLNRWDVLYYQEKIRKARYDVDEEALRKYFPMPAAVNYALLISSKLYGVKFQQAEVPVWHEDVTYYDVVDEKTGQYIGGIYLDLYPRDGKYKHAAAFPSRAASTLAEHTPVSTLVTNFNRDGLTPREMQTLMHEFGHVLHGVLSATKYASQAGTSVERDFVEAPSQMFEEWARRPEALGLFRAVCADCPVLDKRLIKRLEDARKYGNGVHYSRQHHWASFDQAMTGEDPGEPLAIWNQMESASLLGRVEGTLGPCAFSHNINHYGASYYGYMWSQVLALDMLSVFGDDIMNPVVGRRFRNVVLRNGGQEPAKIMVRRFLGREPNSKAFFEEITGKR